MDMDVDADARRRLSLDFRRRQFSEPSAVSTAAENAAQKGKKRAAQEDAKGGWVTYYHQNSLPAARQAATLAGTCAEPCPPSALSGLGCRPLKSAAKLDAPWILCDVLLDELSKCGGGGEGLSAIGPRKN